MILETAKQFVEQTGTNKNQAPYYQAILFIYIVLLISLEKRGTFAQYATLCTRILESDCSLYL